MGAALLGGSEKVQKPPLKTSMLNLSLHCMLKISSTDECVSSTLTGPLIKSELSDFVQHERRQGRRSINIVLN